MNTCHIYVNLTEIKDLIGQSDGGEKRGGNRKENKSIQLSLISLHATESQKMK
jgi:hypothetical protein